MAQIFEISLDFGKKNSPAHTFNYSPYKLPNIFILSLLSFDFTPTKHFLF
jgi:hypothetical protein